MMENIGRLPPCILDPAEITKRDKAMFVYQTAGTLATDPETEDNKLRYAS